MSSPVRRAVPHLLGRRPPTAAALWAAGGRKALSAAASVTVPLALGVALGHPDLGSAAALGGLTAVYGSSLPYRRRAGVVAGCAAVVVAAVALGGLTDGSPALLSVTLGALAAAATAATAHFRVGPPGPLGVVLVGGSASALGADATVLAEHVAAAAAGATLAWLVVMLPWLWDPAGPERRSVAAARAAVAAARSTRPAVVARAVRVADAAVAAGSRRRPSLRAELGVLEEQFLRELPLGDAPAPPPGGAAVAVRPVPPWVWTSLRIGLGVAAAGLVAGALGLASTYWAATTAVAVLLGTDARNTRARAGHRVTGTLVGVGVAALLFAADLPVGLEVLAVGLLLVGVELLVAHQYVLAVSFITPLSLLLVHVGVPERSGLELITTRLTETVVGIVLALAAGLLLFPRAASRRLPGVVATAGARARALVEGTVDEGTVDEGTVDEGTVDEGTVDDRALHDALVVLNEVATAARAELRPAAGTEAWLRRGRWTADLGWGLLGTRARGESHLADVLAARVRADL
ncbi:FUSC family protein [Modestobacter sp. Leaf380]|uniref:FUSC family protein n=1 Tax=Modestobacter sp. Leaf380 TaxID=1736356 RepID=UPI00070163CA|nr:FUSC family protein [Modestobacter sp. Leaf380]KQS66037.1 hypothetical protein ASG41_11695 [Modestobacter sp. Leaf380]